MFGLGPASSAHHLLADHHHSALKGAARLQLARHHLTGAEDEFISTQCLCLFIITNTQKSFNCVAILSTKGRHCDCCIVSHTQGFYVWILCIMQCELAFYL